MPKLYPKPQQPSNFFSRPLSQINERHEDELAELVHPLPAESVGPGLESFRFTWFQ